ncbi:MAG: bifunctional 5,10-methylenetetrahydrofolate dehydrogenase/5,10-methenyltetrahydrofolate cyclohydrolase [Candidatus Omnitrophica bacterium]|nr:bifunctional 5,10-methylenetetrahydrofolate dehydrogenase/5,10-methenyltetrahydrofolate cyclohydrolase [Candidatus Omnitrophota bacterium]
MAKLLEGKPIAERIKEEIREQALSLRVKPVLASVMMGDDPGAVSYSKSQARVAQELGIEYQPHNLKANTTETHLLDFIKKLNTNKSVHGIIIQNPVPAQVDYKKLSSFIDPGKDIEGIHPGNIGKLIFGGSRLIPCTAYAVMELILASGVDLYGKEAVIVGHSEIVGKPLALLLLERFATVTVCHIGTSKAGKLEGHVKRAEILIVAVGCPGLIKGAWVKEGSVVIDVGINRVGDNIVGDVEFTAAEKRAAYITPVPGGVGPLTVVMLMRNLIEAIKSQQSGEYV